MPSGRKPSPNSWAGRPFPKRISAARANCWRKAGKGYPDSARLRVISTMDVLRGEFDFGFRIFTLRFILGQGTTTWSEIMTPIKKVFGTSFFSILLVVVGLFMVCSGRMQQVQLEEESYGEENSDEAYKDDLLKRLEVLEGETASTPETGQ